MCRYRCRLSSRGSSSRLRQGFSRGLFLRCVITPSSYGIPFFVCCCAQTLVFTSTVLPEAFYGGGVTSGKKTSESPRRRCRELVAEERVCNWCYVGGRIAYVHVRYICGYVRFSCFHIYICCVHVEIPHHTSRGETCLKRVRVNFESGTPLHQAEFAQNRSAVL